ncbi:MAG TPA: hypothetical protein VMP89_05940 [Solirubrobacteraceae bacterium]|nr:hypothetical protein [Solirubrobacteraceae bacterium]
MLAARTRAKARYRRIADVREEAARRLASYSELLDAIGPDAPLATIEAIEHRHALALHRWERLQRQLVEVYDAELRPFEQAAETLGELGKDAALEVFLDYAALIHRIRVYKTSGGRGAGRKL